MRSILYLLHEASRTVRRIESASVILVAAILVTASMAETVDGRSWEALIKQYIFDELGMKHAGFSWAGKRGENVPWGHAFDNGWFRPVDPNGS